MLTDSANLSRSQQKRELPNVALILLAAGASTRMGRPKQLLPYKGISLLRHAAVTAVTSPCRPIIAVIGADAARMKAELAGMPIACVENHTWADGMGTSIRTGIETIYAMSPQPDAVVLMLCDQPLVTPQLIAEIVGTFVDTGADLVSAAYGEVYGVPALFSKKYYPDLAALPGTEGAKQILRKHGADVIPIAFPNGLVDLDTDEDYKSHIERYG